ncbi:F-box DNA helicase 1 isoform X2 [Bombina bombina]|uniref:F-box DNA helicase 1 isoform X2 n=1 Tax=Bombina bombina TaxID=8345 RepID=UPI00235B1AA6|nr:F-box DNA helicase 1 isoform X2 [Bombina bombina]
MRRQKRLTHRDCEELALSREGSFALTQPFVQRRTNRDVNLGLYPRIRTERRGRGRGQNDFHNNVGSNKSTEVTRTNSAASSNRPVETEEMEFSDSDDELLCSQMEEFPELFDGNTETLTSQPSSSKKRSYSCGDCDQAPKCLRSEGDCSSSFEEHYVDDEEMDSIMDSLPESCYGLLGVTDCKEPYWEQMNTFPDELLQCIFGFLPIVDLYKNVSLVCQKWRNLVNDPLFIPWKKRYHQYLGNHAVIKVEDILTNNGITADNELCVLNLVRYFATFECSRTANPQAVLVCLKSHHLYPKAEACVTCRLPELGKTSEAVNVWAVLAVIVLFASNVGDIVRLTRCLQHSKSSLRLVEIMEALYCLATLLFAMRRKKILISNRIHYNIFYCLYLMENSSSSGQISETCGSSNFKNQATFNLTNEQQQIINHDIAPGQVVKIMAFAGTGKTSTLIKYAETRPHLKFLYVTFNKSMAQHSQGKFPKNVTCRNFHSLAYEKIGRLYGGLKKLNPSKLTAYSVNMILPKGRAGYIRGKLVAKTLETFFSSTDETIGEEHVPVWAKNNHGVQEMVSPEETFFAKLQAIAIWNNMKLLHKTNTPAYKMTHDGYLKLWQLGNPHLNYDAIFVDEAQDCTPAIMQVVLSQKCGKIFVGDPHQQIYTFRGAVNALYEVQHSHIFYLTQSFRFGAEIAYVGATILDTCKKVQNKTLVGTNQESSLQGQSAVNVAILCRTNSGVFDEAVRVTEGENPSRIHIIGGPDNFGLNKILSIWVLLQPEAERSKRGLYVTDNSIAMWQKQGGYAALKKYAVSAEEKELEAKIAVVEKYKNQIPDLVTRIQNCHTADQTSADYTLGTVHKAKGMEFETVHVMDDFVKIPVGRHNMERVPVSNVISSEDEWNLLYVAVTRAKRHLVITKSIEDVLTLGGEYFLSAELTSRVVKEGIMQCALDHCKNPLLENTALTMKKTPMIYSNGNEDKGGYFCHACVNHRMGPITYLLSHPDLVKSMELKLENLVLPMHIQILLEEI